MTKKIVLLSYRRIEGIPEIRRDGNNRIVLKDRPLPMSGDITTAQINYCVDNKDDIEHVFAYVGSSTRMIEKAEGISKLLGTDDGKPKVTACYCLCAQSDSGSSPKSELVRTVLSNCGGRTTLANIANQLQNDRLDAYYIGDFGNNAFQADYIGMRSIAEFVEDLLAHDKSNMTGKNRRHEEIKEFAKNYKL